MSDRPADGDELNRAIDRAANCSAIPGNRVRLLIDGPENYTEMLAMIESATRRIHVENYIFRSDTIGKTFADALALKALSGVRVRVLHDWLGSISTPRRHWRMLRDAGVEVRAFSPPRVTDPLALVSRDHRKLLTVDGAKAVTGGLCIGDEWVGDPSRHREPWRDTGILVEGPAARAMDHAFATTWSHAGGTTPDDSVEVDAEVTPAGTTAVRVVATRPGDGRAWRVLDLLLGLATERIWVTDAYLAAPARLYQMFQDAASDGVDVRLLVPGGSDIPLVRNISRTGYRRLLRSKVRIWEWSGIMLHAKTATIDGRWIRVGSSNLNHSSLLANWEIDLFIEDAGLAEAMERQYSGDLGGSGEIITRPRALPPMPVLGRPTSLVIEGGAVRHRAKGLRARRKQAVVRAVALIRAARAALLATASGVFIAFAVVLALFPRLAAYSTAAIFGLLGIFFLLGSINRRRHG
ncbi:MAG TPA: phospholipase D-like domain-containing protein [Gemmatimonadales bacterium]|nr:phospholipase D-like domain-containing protein [Gemmatimonadales bacterium]